MLNLSMSYDHRIIDGATAGAFLQGVRSFVENWPDGSHR
jgi:pyruvate/2-oxoglutarate dehydrogenase complex dihydrolipoamide acyltransferase (E2) component